MVIALSAADQTVEVAATVPLAELARILADVGMALPLGDSPGMPNILGDALLMGLPHALEAQAGPWRQWILGGRVRLPDEAAGFVGARVVKSVAGYDIHKFLVGSRGGYGRFETAVLRLAPIGAVPPSEAEPGLATQATHVVRCRLSHFAELRTRWADRIVLADPASSTLWIDGVPEALPPDAISAPLRGPLPESERATKIRQALGG